MLPLILCLLALVLWWLATRTRQAAGLPAGEVVYSDTWLRVEKPLFSRALGLTGKPDYLVQTAEGYVPVEVKSARAPMNGPYPAHIYQLAAYCALVTETYRRPAYGLIRYADRTLQVAYTAQLERELRALLAEMRTAAQAPDVARSHRSPARCRACGFKAVCDEALQ